jgi:hypothetical protein
MGKFGVNYSTIQDFKIEEVQETSGSIVLHLSVFNDAGQTKYRICHDRNEPDLNLIKTSLETGLQQAFNTDKDFIINEYLERSYIYVNYPDGETKQYTAQRLK